MYLFCSHLLEYGGTVADQNDQTRIYDNRLHCMLIGPPRLFPPLSMNKQTSKRGGSSYIPVFVSIYLFRSHLLQYGGTVADRFVECSPLLMHRSAAFVPTIEYGQTDTGKLLIR